MPKRFVNEVREVAKKFAWIKRINSSIVEKVARIRLWINDSLLASILQLKITKVTADFSRKNVR